MKYLRLKKKDEAYILFFNKECAHCLRKLVNGQGLPGFMSLACFLLTLTYDFLWVLLLTCLESK